MTRSPYSVPGVIRLTVAVGASFDRGRPSDGAMAAFGAAQFAASGAPWSLRKVPRDQHVDLRKRVGPEAR